MEINIQNWPEANIKEIAHLTHEVLQHSLLTRRKERTAEGITAWFHTLKFGSPFTGTPVVVTAHEEKRLLGWLMLCTTGPKTVEVVPWELIVRPVIAPDCDRADVITKLVEKAVLWAQEKDVILLRIDKIPGGEDEVIKDMVLYESFGFSIREDSVYMNYYITGDEEGYELPDRIELKKVEGVDREDLYQWFYNTFSAGLSPFFFDQDEDERRESFDLLFEGGCLDKDASLAIVKSSQVVGFSFVKPFGIGGNMLLEWIGIHPDYRRRGLGEFLLHHIMKKVFEKGYTTMSLSCAVGNTPAFNFYRKCGWVIEGGEIIFSLRI